MADGFYKQVIGNNEEKARILSVRGRKSSNQIVLTLVSRNLKEKEEKKTNFHEL